MREGPTDQAILLLQRVSELLFHLTTPSSSEGSVLQTNDRHFPFAKAGLLVLAVFIAFPAKGSAQWADPFIPLRSDSATEAEAKRIATLPTPPVELMAGPSQEAQMRAEAYLGRAQRSFPEAALFDDPTRPERASRLADDVTKSVNPCDPAKLAAALSKLRDELGRLGSALAKFAYDLGDVEGGIQRGVIQADRDIGAYALDDMTPGSRATSECTPDTRAHFGSPKFKQGVEALVRIQHQQARNIASTLESEKPRAEKLAAAWNQRYAKLVSSVEAQKKQTVDIFVTQLPLIVTIFCAFALLVIATVRLFGPDLQMEWIASGQVIQFASVMILLVIVTTLGILGKIDGQTVGTLLGGIAGYVLSQGVGRAAARAVERNAQQQSVGESRPANTCQALDRR